MFRHVSQHDLPLSIQESRKKQTNIRGFQFLASHASAQHRREFRVNVYPQKKISNQDVIEDHFCVPQNSEEIVLNHTTACLFNGDIRKEQIELKEEETIDNILPEDEINNNNDCNNNSGQLQKDSLIYNEKTSEIQNEDKSIQTTCLDRSFENKCTQTNLDINADTSIVAHNQVTDKNLLNKPYKINVKKFNSRSKCKIDCSSKERLKEKLPPVKLSRKCSPSKLSTKGTGIQTDPLPVVKSDGIEFKIEEFLKFLSCLPQVFFCSVILLAVLCTASLIIKLFLMPYINYISLKIIYLLSSEHESVNFHQKFLSLLLKPVTFVYEIIFDTL